MILRTLGQLKLEPSSFTMMKPLLMVVYVAIEGPQVRRKLAELFWQDGSNPMKSVSMALTRLRQGAEGSVQVNKDIVSTNLTLDVQALQVAFNTAEFEKVINQYSGAFLKDAYLDKSNLELEEWLYEKREYFAALVREANLRLAETKARTGDFMEAAKLAEQAYDTEAAAEPELEDFKRIYALLRTADAIKARAIQKEAEIYGLALEFSIDEAKALYMPQQKKGIPFSLPTRGTTFVGRTLELTELNKLLANNKHRLITLLGQGGAGKSRLAVQLAYEQLHLKQFHDGIYFVDLAPLLKANEIIPAIANVLDYKLGEETEAFKQLATFLISKKILLILDNFEHLPEGMVLVNDFLQTCTNLKIIATSRERLNLEEEWVLKLEGLSFPKAKAKPEKNKSFDAVTLFVDRAKRAEADFTLNEGNQTAVLKIIRLLEGIPLGIELAAAWVKHMPCQEIYDEIKTNLDFLTTRTRNITERHRSLRAAFEYSWALLSQSEKEALAKLSVFQGGFVRKAAEKVAGANLFVLAKLVDKSLISASTSGRYKRHALLLQFMEEKLAEDDNLKTRTRNNHAKYYAEVLKEHALNQKKLSQQDRYQYIENELANLKAAWRWLANTQQFELLHAFSLPFCHYYDFRGNIAEGQKLFEEAIDSLKKDTPEIIAGRLYNSSARLLARVGRLTQAKKTVNKALSILTSESFEKAQALNTLGIVYGQRGESSLALEAHLASYKEYKNLGKKAGLSVSLNNIAEASRSLGDYEKAKDYYRQAKKINQEHNNNAGVALNLSNLGNLLITTGELDKAKSVLEESYKLAKQINYVRVIPAIQERFGRIAMNEGNLSDAKKWFEEAMQTSVEIERWSLVVELNVDFAYLNYEYEYKTLAFKHLEQALELAHQKSLKDMMQLSILALAKLQIKETQLTQARCLLGYLINCTVIPFAIQAEAKQLLSNAKLEESADCQDEEKLMQKAWKMLKHRSELNHLS